MSETLTPETPGPDSAASPVGDSAPGDGTAVESGSVGAETEMVEAKRFNGLMSAHQKALADLESERTMRTALEARLNQQEETAQVTETNDATLSEIQQLRKDLQDERLKAARATALERYPDAKPFADLIVGDTPEDIENVAAAIATRFQAIVAPAATAATTTEVETPITETAPAAPVVGGGGTAPVEASNAEKVKEALEKKDWGAFWAAKTNSDVSTLA
jgi:hypothetical protein